MLHYKSHGILQKNKTTIDNPNHMMYNIIRTNWKQDLCDRSVNIRYDSERRIHYETETMVFGNSGSSYALRL